MFSRAIATYQAGIAAVVFAFALTGCGGGGSGSTSGVPVNDSQTGEEPAAEQSRQTGESLSVEITWVAPSFRKDGSGLSGEISGYIVRYGRDASELEFAEASDCVAVSCGVDLYDLEPGIWYFSVQTVDTDGLTSEPSDLASKTI